MNQTTSQLTITRPDDWHLHVRDDDAMAAVISHTARQFARAIIMPNLRPPVTTTDKALTYRERILSALPRQQHLPTPDDPVTLPTTTMPEEIICAKESGLVHAAKLYPAGATTNSDNGVSNLENIYPTLEKMEEQGLPLLIHGEVTASKYRHF